MHRHTSLMTTVTSWISWVGSLNNVRCLATGLARSCSETVHLHARAQVNVRFPRCSSFSATSWIPLPM
jgi:hypothetical protein